MDFAVPEVYYNPDSRAWHMAVPIYMFYRVFDQIHLVNRQWHCVWNALAEAGCIEHMRNFGDNNINGPYGMTAIGSGQDVEGYEENPYNYYKHQLVFPLSEWRTVSVHSI